MQHFSAAIKLKITLKQREKMQNFLLAMGECLPYHTRFWLNFLALGGDEKCLIMML